MGLAYVLSFSVIYSSTQYYDYYSTCLTVTQRAVTNHTLLFNVVGSGATPRHRPKKCLLHPIGYGYFIKKAWRQRLRLVVNPYPKPDEQRVKPDRLAGIPCANDPALLSKNAGVSGKIFWRGILQEAVRLDCWRVTLEAGRRGALVKQVPQ